MDDSMRECVRKLALWYTKTFKPIMTHEELEPIMSTLGFLSQPPKTAPNGVKWKEYVYTGKSSVVDDEGLGNGGQYLTVVPKPRLPYQRIDGLHIYTYRAFIEAVNFYLEMDDISELFHIRGMPLNRVYDRNKKFRRMEADENLIVYREGTIDPASYDLYHPVNRSEDDDQYHHSSWSSNNLRSHHHNSVVLRNKEGGGDGGGGAVINSGKLSDIVPLKDIGI